MSSTAADYMAQALAQVNPDYAKGSATGAMNFLVFVLSAVVGPAFGWLLQKLAGGAALSLDVFVKADGVYVVAIVVAAIVALFLKETGSAAQKAH